MKTNEVSIQDLFKILILTFTYFFMGVVFIKTDEDDIMFLK